jgi:O-antigen ligase
MISMAPWRTATELMKLATYMMTTSLAFVLCQRAERAQQLMDALVAIGALYAFYALILGMLGVTQLEVLYTTPPVGGWLAGPFVGHAHFATFVGLLALCACVRLFSLGGENIAAGRGVKPLFLSTLKFVFGRGLFPLLAFVALFSMLIATAARAGVIAALIGLIVMLLLSSLISTRRATSRWAWAAIVIFAFGAVLLFQINGDTLQARFDDLTEGGEGFGLRTVFWNAASRMIGDAPWKGLGLGAFEKAYPLFADHLYPFNMDKTHNDYLELAQGLGLPATIAWCGSVMLLAMMCLRGIFVRKRHRIYALVAVSATALVSFHAIFDFSLQIPAVSLTFAAILGMGAAQSFPSRPIV